MTKMSEPEILARLPDVKGWERLGDMLVRTWRFASARRALEFVQLVAASAEKSGHYPDILLSYRDVRVEVSTHEAGGLTPPDFAMAAEISGLPSER